MSENDVGKAAGPGYRVGIDIGGTFTDLVVHSIDGGTLFSLKVLTTPDDPSRAVFDGLRALKDVSGIELAEVVVIVHATTLATNTLIEGNGAKAALITTEGFRDILEMRKETRYDDYDLAIEFPPPLIPRQLCREVRERMLADGGVRIPLDEDDVRGVLADLKETGIEALAVCLIHASANPAHEERIGELAAEVLEGLPVSISSRVQPEIREYLRTNTTVANAYIQPRVQRYIENLTNGLARGGYMGPLHIMQSNGGFAGPDESSTYPVRLIESGPAAGAVAAADYGQSAGETDLVSFDMGGTTAKIAVLRGGEPRMATELEVARIRRFKAGSGYPIKCSSIELAEIGAGGGSIASIDALGLVRVGPQSAGAAPGPVCYGLGGREPTVTDADLVLGYIDPDTFAGGRMPLDRDAAEAAIRERIAQPAGLETIQAAWGIHDIVNQNMTTAARLHILERGEDPRQFTLIAFGGAGPIHAHRMAGALGITRTLYPVGAGVASAHGLLVAPMAVDLVRTYHARVDAIDWGKVTEIFASMEASAYGSMRKGPGDNLTSARFADMRYSGQGYEIQVPIPDGPYRADSSDTFEQAFLDAYERIFDRRIIDAAIEVVNFRLSARGPRPVMPNSARPSAADGGPARKGERPVYLAEAGDYVACPVYHRYRLTPGTTIAGPAILEEEDTAVVIGPDGRGFVDEALNVIVERSSTDG